MRISDWSSDVCSSDLYEIADIVSQKRGKRVAPNSVYRILDLFVANNLVRRVESANAFVANSHPGCLHDCIFLICDSCGNAVHVDNDLLSDGIGSAHVCTPATNVLSVCRLLLEKTKRDLVIYMHKQT